MKTKQLVDAIHQVAELYHRLVLVVAPSGAGKSNAIRDTANRLSGHYININLELSQRLLYLAERQRAVKVSQFLGEITAVQSDQVLFLDNLELLFDVSLRQDPLRLLQGISRHRTVAASWNGVIKDDCLIYAQPGHPEYRFYSATGLTVVTITPPHNGVMGGFIDEIQ